MQSIQEVFPQAQALAFRINADITEIERIRGGERDEDGFRKLHTSPPRHGYHHNSAFSSEPALSPEALDLVTRKTMSINSSLQQLEQDLLRLERLAMREGARSEMWKSYV